MEDYRLRGGLLRDRDRVQPDRERGRQSRNGRRPDRRDRPRQPRARNEYMNNSYQPQLKLLKHNDRQPVMPGSVSIMQRDSNTSGSENTVQSPEMINIPNHNHLPHSPSSSSSSSAMSGVPVDGKRPPRRPDGMSSGPSTYTPLQPSLRQGRGERDTSVFSRTEHTAFLTQATDTYSMKLIDKSMRWEDRIPEHLMDQSDFLVAGVLGKQGAGKSTVMSLLAGTRTGSARPYLFKTQSKETHDSGGYQTSGVDMVVTSERIILLDTQPILSETMLDQLVADGVVPAGVSPESYLDVVSLQIAIFLFTVCHVVMVVLESKDAEVMLRFLYYAERLKPLVRRQSYDSPDSRDGLNTEHFPQIVFVLNHATSDDFQPGALREFHCLLADSMTGSRLSVAGGVSLLRSGLVPTGRLVPFQEPHHGGISSRSKGEVDEGDVNLYLLPTNTVPQDCFGAHCVVKKDRDDVGLNPVLSLLPTYSGHPSFHLLAETLRNQVFAMPRLPLRHTHPSAPLQQQQPQQQPMFEKDWYDYSRKVWVAIKRTDLLSEQKRMLMQETTE